MYIRALISVCAHEQLQIQTFIVMSRAQFTVAISTDEEAAASKRMVIYTFSAQINLFTSFFLKASVSLVSLAWRSH